MRGEGLKMKADIPNLKSVVVNEYNNSSYCHISDVSKCFGKGGSFDIKKSKSVTLNRDDVNNFARMIDQIPTAMDQVLAESIHCSRSDGSSSDDEKQSKQKKVRKQRKLKACKRTTHDVSDQSETSSSEKEEGKVTKILKTKVKKQRKTGHPYAVVKGELQHHNKRTKPKKDKKITKASFKTKTSIDSGSDTDVLTD